MLKFAPCFFLLKSCGPPNEVVWFFGPRLKKLADPRVRWFVWPFCADSACGRVRRSPERSSTAKWGSAEPFPSAAFLSADNDNEEHRSGSDTQADGTRHTAVWRGFDSLADSYRASKLKGQVHPGQQFYYLFNYLFIYVFIQFLTFFFNKRLRAILNWLGAI